MATRAVVIERRAFRTDKARFLCNVCGPTNRVIRDNEHDRFVCCACDEGVARDLARSVLTS